MEKVVIPDELLPPNHRGKGYRMTESGVIYGVRGHALTHHTFSPNGFNHPILLGRNVWYIRAVMFVPNPNNYSKVVEVDDEVIWISDEKYFDMVQAYNPRVQAGVAHRPVSFKSDEIVDMYKQGYTIVDIASEYDCSRKAIYNILKKRGLR